MKMWMIALTALIMTACQQGGSGGGGNTAVTPTAQSTPTTDVVTPLSKTCLDGTTYCNNSIYQNQYGFLPYPGMYNRPYNYTNYFNQYGFCDCPSRYMPVYNNTYGLGCVRQQLLQPYSGFFLYWRWQTGSTGWGYVGYEQAAPQMPNNFPQFSNIPSASNSYPNCAKTLTQSCLLDQSNTCGAAASCRPVLLGSNLGVCVSH